MAVVERQEVDIFDLPVSEQVEYFSEIDGRSSRERVIEYGSWLSVHYAQDGHQVPPVHSIVAQAKEEYPELPSRDVLLNVLGNMAELPNALGFVMPDRAKEWTDEEYIENGRWLSHALGSPEAPVMPTRADVEVASTFRIGPPRMYIVERFGSLKGYQAALGFVNDHAVKSWEDEDWKDYGTWLSHMLGSPEEPVEPTIQDMATAAKLNIGPPIRDLYRRFGSFPEYKATLGFDVNTLGYKSWSREKYIENGRWLSHMLGSREVPRMPTMPYIREAASLGIAPPLSAINKRFRGALSNYQDALGFVNAKTLERWSEEDWIQNGRWLSHALGSPEVPVMPNAAHIEEAAALDLIPKVDQIIKKFGSIVNYQKALGFHHSRHHQEWTDRDFLRYGMKLVRANGGRRPNYMHYQIAYGPTRSGIQSRFGSLAKFHERLGFPDYGSFTEAELVSFGVRWAHEHEGVHLLSTDFTQLSADRQGPSREYIYKMFGSFTAYRERVEKEYGSFLELREEYHKGRTSAAVLDFLLRDFEATPEYREQFAERMSQVASLRSGGVKFTTLCELFGGSRRTMLWDKDDFIYFRSLVAEEVGDTKKLVETLRVLDGFGLSPYLDEIEEMFGSLEEFAEYM